MLTALSDAFSDDDVQHPAVEVETLRWAHPPFSDEEEMRHLRAICALYREAGHRLLLIARTIETNADLARLLDAIGAEEHFLVRLEARPVTLAHRIIEREPEGWSGLSDLVAHSQRSRPRCPP